jgi:hypothetical protein
VSSDRGLDPVGETLKSIRSRAERRLSTNEDRIWREPRRGKEKRREEEKAHARGAAAFELECSGD